MKKIMFSGLPADITEDSVRAAMEKLGPVGSLSIIREGNPDAPVVVVELDISDGWAHMITSRTTDLWHDGRVINARILPH